MLTEGDSTCVFTIVDVSGKIDGCVQWWDYICYLCQYYGVLLHPKVHVVYQELLWWVSDWLV